ncbi:hypothetical protein [Saccharolobus islandicus]|uniref:Uncharacterized protein n=1 Tax=Saccharolobus islandicus (strain REY15A) TaxID=930945 RepID=F0NBK0_SACI5|nr:hypothetical protein [Sulfolobus islandicus]ADX85537.1 hypothetical protein SiRe_1472 [Sulfolobus islandicus REY15A]
MLEILLTVQTVNNSLRSAKGARFPERASGFKKKGKAHERTFA